MSEPNVWSPGAESAVTQTADHGPATGSEWTPERVAAVSRNVALVAAAGIAFGVFATAANVYYVVITVAAAALAIVVAWKFEAALMLYALVAFVPWGETPHLAVGGSGLGKGLYVSEIMLGFLLAIWLGKYLLGALPRDRIRTGFHIPIILYLAYSVLNVVHSFLFWDAHVSKLHQHPSVNIIEIGLRFLSAGAFLMLATSVGSPRWLRWTTLFVMIPGLYNLANALMGNLLPISAPWWPLVALLPVCYCWAVALDREQARWKRLGGAAVVGAAIFVIGIQSIAWVSGWLGLLVSLAVVTFLRNRRLFVAAALLGCVVALTGWTFFHENVVTESQASGDYDRFDLLRGAWKYASTFPLGVGLGNYRSYNSFHYGEKWGTTTYTSAHGTYAQHLSEMGLPGLALLAAVLVCGLGWMAARCREARNARTKTYLLASVGQMAGIGCAAFFGDYILPSYHNGGLVTFSATVYSWIIWGLAAAHVRLDSYGSVHFDR